MNRTAHRPRKNNGSNLHSADLGAGKTTFARGFINFKLGIDESVEVRVTSPTYLLSNTYEYRDENEALQEYVVKDDGAHFLQNPLISNM